MLAGGLSVAIVAATLACAVKPAVSTTADQPVQTGALRPTVVLISLDGFRADYFERFAPPTLARIATEGVRAEAMIPSFPTLTFPNHYTLVTGLYPERHGIVANTMYDPVFDAMFTLTNGETRNGRWWGGEPIWVTATKQGKIAASFFWPGSEAEILGIRPSRWKPYDGRVPYTARVDTVLAWLDLPAEHRPQLITLYFDEPDHTGHDAGPFSPETRAAVFRVDSMIDRLDQGLRVRGLAEVVNLIVVSDHGMSPISTERTVFVEDVVDPATVRTVIVSPVLMANSRTGNDRGLVAALRRLPHVSAWLKHEVPERLHFRNHRRITPVVAIADDSWTIELRRPGTRGPRGGHHGYDNANRSMWALFLARGPAFRPHVILPPFANIHVYSLLAHLLELTPAANDGELGPFRPALHGPRTDRAIKKSNRGKWERLVDARYPRVRAAR